MNNKIKYCILAVLSLLSAIVIAFFGGDYLGAPFEYDFVYLIFSLIGFSCISTIHKIDDSSLFYNEYKVIRYKKRTSVICIETIKRCFCTFVYSSVNGLVISAIKKADIKRCITFIVFNFLSILFIELVQFCLEVKTTSAGGYFATIVAYTFLMFVGISLKNYCDAYSDDVSKLFEIANKLNVVNYSSLIRISQLKCNVEISVFSLAVLDIITAMILIPVLKKTDIINRMDN